jgi:hypothetical protein
MRASALALAALLLSCAGPDQTFFHVRVEFAAGAGPFDQLRVSLLLEGQPLLAPARLLPPNPGPAVHSGEQFTILLPDGRASQHLTVRVTGLQQGAPLAWGEADAVVKLREEVDVTVTLDRTPALVSMGLAIAPAMPLVPLGQTKQLAAIGTYDDGSTFDLARQASWQTADPNTATVDDSASKGLATGKMRGTTAITASALGQIASDTLTVSAQLTSIDVTPADPTVAQGASAQLTATAHFQDGSTLDMTRQVQWISDDPTVATVDDRGLAAGVKAGTTRIEASYSGVTGSTGITVTVPTITSLAMTPPTASLTTGQGLQLKLTAYYSDHTSADVTLQANWESSNTLVATVSDSGSSRGKVSPVAPGMATITAHLLGQQAQAMVTVTL